MSVNRIISSFRTLLSSVNCGVLSTFSVDVPGFPFGSVVPFCLDRNHLPIIKISNIAQHTKNIKSNNAACLTVLENSASGDVQASGRISFLATVIMDEDVEDHQVYYRYFPEAKEYNKTHGFDFYKLEPERARYIGGFGDINWVEKGSLVYENHLLSATQTQILEHMNADHKSSLVAYLKKFRNHEADSTSVAMVGIDQDGFDVLSGKQIFHFVFEEPIHDGETARRQLVEMSKASKF